MQCLIFAVCINRDLGEVADSGKIKPTRKILDIRYKYVLHISLPTMYFLRKPVTAGQLHHDFILENIIGDQMVCIGGFH